MFDAGLPTLIKREIIRFLKVYNQTIIGPVVNSILYFTVFTVVFASSSQHTTVNYTQFVASGLIIMSMLQNAYANAQGTIVTAKVLGFVVDFIIPPLSRQTVLLAILIASVFRGIIVGIANFIVLSFFTSLGVHSLPFLFAFSILSCLLFALLGVITGVPCKSFDSSTSYNTYLIVPLTFLSGTFYSINALPLFWQKVIMLNPVFYIIDGFRFSLIGISDSPVGSHVLPLIILAAWVIILSFLANFLMERKYHEN